MGGSGLVAFCLVTAASVAAANATTTVLNTDHYWGCSIIKEIIICYDKTYCMSISLFNILQGQTVVKWT